jgi:hypothetical protein
MGYGFQFGADWCTARSSEDRRRCCINNAEGQSINGLI